MKRIYFLLLLTCAPLWGDTNPDFEIQKRFEHVNARWEAFQDEISWFLKEIAPATDVEENDFTEKWKDEYEQTVEAIQAAQTAFLHFRDEMATALSAPYNSNRYGATVYSISIVEITEWYIHYMEENLFPSNWKERYQKSLQN